MSVSKETGLEIGFASRGDRISALRKLGRDCRTFAFFRVTGQSLNRMEMRCEAVQLKCDVPEEKRTIGDRDRVIRMNWRITEEVSKEEGRLADC